MARYGRKSRQKVKRAMHERKRGTLRSGRSGKKVKSRKQAIAIGLSQARPVAGNAPRAKGRGRKCGTLRSGRSGKKVKSRKQAIAIGLSEARRAGAKVPRRKGRKRKSSRRKK